MFISPSHTPDEELHASMLCFFVEKLNDKWIIG
jgi:hypothetical protein